MNVQLSLILCGSCCAMDQGLAFLCVALPSCTRWYYGIFCFTECSVTCACVMQMLGLNSCRIVYVESICRVESLSLSGKLLYWLYIANDILVQWPELQEKYPRTKYIGLLV